MSNKAEGTKLEKEIARKLANYGFFVHLLQDRKNGQPADMIAAAHGRAYLIDCKDCQSGEFDLSRIEPNQHGAAKRWRETGNGEMVFALRMPNEAVWMLTYRDIEMADRKVFSAKNIRQLSDDTLDTWATARAKLWQWA